MVAFGGGWQGEQPNNAGQGNCHWWGAAQKQGSRGAGEQAVVSEAEIGPQAMVVLGGERNGRNLNVTHVSPEPLMR